MNESALTKNELALKLAEHVDVTQTKAQDAIQFILEAISGALVNGRKVEFRNFGVFSVARRAERCGRNPANLAAGVFTIPARNVVKFRTGVELSKALNGERKEGLATPLQ